MANELIYRQMQGLPLVPEKGCSTKVEYQLRAPAGRVVVVYDDEERARLQLVGRNLKLFRVTIISEEL